jgi:hypothetical protein
MMFVRQQEFCLQMTLHNEQNPKQLADVMWASCLDGSSNRLKLLLEGKLDEIFESTSWFKVSQATVS